MADWEVLVSGCEGRICKVKLLLLPCACSGRGRVEGLRAGRSVVGYGDGREW